MANGKWQPIGRHISDRNLIGAQADSMFQQKFTSGVVIPNVFAYILNSVATENQISYHVSLSLLPSVL